MASSNLPRLPSQLEGVPKWLQAFVRVWDSLFQGEGDRSLVMLGQIRGQTPLVGVVDGVNTIFTAPYTILRDSTTGNPLAILMTKNLGWQVYGVDWKLTERPETVVFTTPPLGGDTVFFAELVCRSK